MGRLFFIAVATLVLIVGCTAKAEVPVAVSDQGWTITAKSRTGDTQRFAGTTGPGLAECPSESPR